SANLGPSLAWGRVRNNPQTYRTLKEPFSNCLGARRTRRRGGTMSNRGSVRALLIGALVMPATAAWAADDASSSDLVCYRVKDPLAISGTVVTSSAVLGVSPPCHIDASATEICVPGTAAALDDTSAPRAQERNTRVRGTGAAAIGAGRADTTADAQTLAST